MTSFTESGVEQTAVARTTALAQAHALRVSTHLWPEVSAQLLCATPTAHWLEYADWWNPVLAEPLEIREGMALAGERPGGGIEWSEGAIRKLLA